MKFVAIALFILTVPLANWLIGNWGTDCLDDGPCLIPVGFGLMAPSGVLVIGAALALRDYVQSRSGVVVALGSVAVGAALALIVAPSGLILASVAAFVMSELLDTAIYTPIRRRNVVLAILMSGTAGALLDSAVFLFIAFGSLDYIAGQVVGKLFMTVLASGGVAIYRWWQP